MTDAVSSKDRDDPVFLVISSMVTSIYYVAYLIADNDNGYGTITFTECS